MRQTPLLTAAAQKRMGGRALVGRRLPLLLLAAAPLFAAELSPRPVLGQSVDWRRELMSPDRQFTQMPRAIPLPSALRRPW